MLDRIHHVWSRLETILIGLLLVAALLVFLGGALVRAVAPAFAVDWAEEVSIYCIVWATLLSGSALIYEGRHINTEVLVGRLPPRPRSALAAAVVTLTLAFCVAVTWYGVEAVSFSVQLGERSPSTLRVPQAWALFLALPVGMGLMSLRLALMVLGGTRAIGGEMRVPDHPSGGETGAGG